MMRTFATECILDGMFQVWIRRLLRWQPCIEIIPAFGVFWSTYHAYRKFTLTAHVIPHRFSLALLLPLGPVERGAVVRCDGVNSFLVIFSTQSWSRMERPYSKMDESCGRVSILRTESLYDRFNKHDFIPIFNVYETYDMKPRLSRFFVEICERKSKFCVIGLATSKSGQNRQLFIFYQIKSVLTLSVLEISYCESHPTKRKCSDFRP